MMQELLDDSWRALICFFSYKLHAWFMSDYVGLFEDSEMENKAFKKIHLVRNFTINTSIEYSKHDSMY